MRELGGARRIVEDEVRAKLADYGTRRRRLNPKDQPFENRALRDVLELTSRESTDKVAAAKDALARSAFAPNGVDVALATNMISVGLDIGRLGLMVVQGQPKAAAEYIQATSRVGRSLKSRVSSSHCSTSIRRATGFTMKDFVNSTPRSIERSKPPA